MRYKLSIVVAGVLAAFVLLGYLPIADAQQSTPNPPSGTASPTPPPIDDDEIMPAYYVYEEMKGLGLDWKIIEAIWSAKGYRWDPTTGFQVVN